MQKIFMCIILAGISCSKRTDSKLVSSFKGYSKWVGCYEYSEHPVQALAGYYMAMEWGLTLTKNGLCYLMIDGQQTMVRIHCRVKPIQSGIEVWFVQDGKENLFPTGPQEGPLFRIVEDKKGKLITDFQSFTPRLSEKESKPGRRRAFERTSCKADSGIFD